MNKEGQKFFICKHCGNLIGMIFSSGAKIVCCGDEMQELVANTSDASQEKHVPVVVVKGDTVTVTIGSVEHPMTEEHHIEWIYLQTCCGGHRKSLKVGAAPETCFKLCENETAIAAFAYCNLHGLWKTVIK
ncbi:desulfoferrodoxin family protein [Oscillospiraceae bacterium PP1C4]